VHYRFRWTPHTTHLHTTTHMHTSSTSWTFTIAPWQTLQSCGVIVAASNMKWFLWRVGRRGSMRRLLRKLWSRMATAVLWIHSGNFCSYGVGARTGPSLRCVSKLLSTTLPSNNTCFAFLKHNTNDQCLQNLLLNSFLKFCCINVYGLYILLIRQVFK